MFLVAERVRGKPLPNELTLAMIPPSMRKTYLENSAQSTSKNTASSASTSLSGLASLSQGVGTTASMVTSTTTTSSAWGAPTTSATVSDDFGFGSDFSAIKELDTISNEIDSIRK